MNYRVGFYGGSFDPLHMGHVSVIMRAASECRRLYLILSFSRKRDSIPMEYRYRWLQNITKDIGNVTILPLEDTANSKAEYDADDYWEQGAREIKDKIGEKIDVVFCGNDYEANRRFEKLYPESRVEYIPRDLIPISSSEIRENPLKMWEYLPIVVRPYFVKKILIVGGESTGKSTLVKKLAVLYNTNYVEEAGREICSLAGGEEYMVAEDLHKCYIYQKEAELKAVEQSSRFLFVDTDALVTEFYCRFLLTEGEKRDRCEALGKSIAGIHDFDLVCFLEPTVEFVQDGTRNEKLLTDRKGYSEQIKQLFKDCGIAFESIDGDYLERMLKIQDIIYKKYGI